MCYNQILNIVCWYMRTVFPLSYLAITGILGSGTMKFKSAEEIRACLEPIAAEQGLTVCAVEFKNSDEPSLTVFIDKAGGVDLDACRAFP